MWTHFKAVTLCSKGGQGLGKLGEENEKLKEI